VDVEAAGAIVIAHYEHIQDDGPGPEGLLRVRVIRWQARAHFAVIVHRGTGAVLGCIVAGGASEIDR
jgi:hypothetical protein